MKERPRAIRLAAFGLLAAALTACAPPSTFTPRALPEAAPAARGTYAVIYRFTGGNGGEHPGALVYDDSSKTVYGTALGATAGLIFRITSSGDERVLYRFAGGADGNTPSGELAIAHNVLYGTTIFGGRQGCYENLGCGTVYSIDLTTGKHSVLYRFPGGSGGAYPSGLMLLDGVFYGTTQSGGQGHSCGNDCGTIFRITNHGQSSVLYSFKGGHDLSGPLASLSALHGVLYGTASGGGCTRRKCGGGGVFSVTAGGVESVLYTFPNKITTTDGLYPDSTPIAYRGSLFGTTPFGGSIASRPCGCGTIFRVDTSHGERVIHRFAGDDGQFPTSGLTEFKGAFYGVTPQGGGSRCLQGKGCGAIFSVRPEGGESVVHRFDERRDGTHPTARLVVARTTLYGTTDSGGGKGCNQQHGCGTVFTWQP